MTLRIGMIGPGNMGRAHIARIHSVIRGGHVVAVSDVDPVTARTVAKDIGAQEFSSSLDLIHAPEVDAVMICSHGPAHEPDVIAAIKAGKPVFCEKPLAPAADACLRIMDAERIRGNRLVTVGFMRRYDASHRELKAVLDSGEIGAPLMVHCAHRNAGVPAHYTRNMPINDTAVHEIDSMRWLLGEEFTSVRVDAPRRTSKAPDSLQDPLILVMETASGVRVDVEVFVNCRYGYDIRCEVVGETGTANLADQHTITRRDPQGHSNRLPLDHNDRFRGAFITEVQEWVDAATRGEQIGPTAWDGYAAAVVCDAGVRALHDGAPIKIRLIEQPELYSHGGSLS